MPMFNQRWKLYLKKSEALHAKLTALIDEDAAAFNEVMTAFGLPKETEEQKTQRSIAIQETTKSATLVPIKLMEQCAEALELVKVVARKGNQNSLSDAGVAVIMLRAGCEGAALNVKTNIRSLQDAAFVESIKANVHAILKNIDDSSQSILNQINEKL